MGARKRASNGVASDGDAEHGAPVPMRIVGEEVGDLRGDHGKLITIHDGAAGKATVNELAIARLEALDLEDGFGRFDPARQRLELISPGSVALRP